MDELRVLESPAREYSLKSLVFDSEKTYFLESSFKSSLMKKTEGLILPENSGVKVIYSSKLNKNLNESKMLTLLPGCNHLAGGVMDDVDYTELMLLEKTAKKSLPSLNSYLNTLINIIIEHEEVYRKTAESRNKMKGTVGFCVYEDKIISLRSLRDEKGVWCFYDTEYSIEHDGSYNKNYRHLILAIRN